MEHPCPAGCGPQWKHPAAERDLVVEGTETVAPKRIEGQAAAAGRMGMDFIGGVFAAAAEDIKRETEH
jgi:hypothetical protein